MTTFSQFMGDDHARCDQLFADAEQAVESGDWEWAEKAHRAFISAMQHHFAMEEELLFPAFEQATGASAGPTVVMRHEHQQMRSLFSDMEQALSERNSDDYLGATETLLILMQQHNAKEEQILYPMSDRTLQAEQAALLEQMQQLGA
ncbi:MAG: hemerythrin domain-containing protein [Pseudomonadota bacterium]